MGCGNLSKENLWSEQVDSGYGNNSSAEFFAQTFKYSVYEPEKIPRGIEPGGAYYFMQALIDVTAGFIAH